MGRASRRKANKIQGTQEPNIRWSIWTIIIAAWKHLLVILGYFATLAGVLSLTPRLSVIATSALDPADPFSTPFTISNDGYLAIHSVTFRCAMRNVRDESNAKLVAFEKGISPMGFLIPACLLGRRQPWLVLFHSDFKRQSLRLTLTSFWRTCPTGSL